MTFQTYTQRAYMITLNLFLCIFLQENSRGFYWQDDEKNVYISITPQEFSEH